MAAIALPVTSKMENTSRAVKGISTEAVPGGSACYLDASALVGLATKVTATGKYGVVGVMVSTAEGAGQNVYYAPPGEIITVSGLASGVAYYLHSSGDVCLFSDLTTGDRVVLVGVALSATRLYLICYDTGITL